MILTSYSVCRNLRRRSADLISARRRCAHEFGSTRGALRGLSASAKDASASPVDCDIFTLARRCGAAPLASRRGVAAPLRLRRRRAPCEP